jgi:hypothetical protein
MCGLGVQKSQMDAYDVHTPHVRPENPCGEPAPAVDHWLTVFGESPSATGLSLCSSRELPSIENPFKMILRGGENRVAMDTVSVPANNISLKVSW